MQSQRNLDPRVDLWIVSSNTIGVKFEWRYQRQSQKRGLVAVNWKVDVTQLRSTCLFHIWPPDLLEVHRKADYPTEFPRS